MNFPPFLLVFLLAGGALAQAPGSPRERVKPLWITVLPEQAGRVYALGLAPLASGEAEALAQAAQIARGEVLGRLRASVKSETTLVSRTLLSRDAGGHSTGHTEHQVDQDIRIRTSATELPGLGVEATWVDLQAATAYALAYLDVPVAEREIRTRFATQKEDLAREGETPIATRERLHMLHRLQGAQGELVWLDDVAALLAAGGGDPALRGKIRASRLGVDREVEALRASLTFGLEGPRGATGIAAILRNSVLKAGLGWAEDGGDFHLVLDYHGDAQTAKVDLQQQAWNGWWAGGWVSHTTTRDTGIIVARGLLTLTIKDRTGKEYESVEIAAKGLGVSEFQAEQRLREDIRTQVDANLTRWLENLGR